jgi:NAD(P)H-nitrite reductase large subunit
MSHYKYLIVGGGMTADSAVRAIRKIDPDGSIALISAEPVAPYNRPPLSKSLGQGKQNSKASGARLKAAEWSFIWDARLSRSIPRTRV